MWPSWKGEVMSDKPIAFEAIPEGYADWLTELETRIHNAQQRAALAVNRELVTLYWQIGHDILARQAAQGWGAKVIERLAHDLRNAFPDMKGFSRANLMYMRAFAEAWPDEQIVQQAVGQLPWGHNLVLLSKLKDQGERLAYAQKAIENGWSRNVLVMQIESAAHNRQGRATTNFVQRLPSPDSDLVQQTLKDPYLFDFLTLESSFHERELVVDDKLRHETDKPTIGLILCQQPNRVLAEYALRGVDKPIGVSSYELTRALPAELQSSLPSIEEIERELQGGQP